MADLPSSGYLSDGARTEGEMKDGFEALRDVLGQVLGGGLAAESLTISGGVITPSRGVIAVDTEGGTGSDDLVTIQTTNLPDGSLLLISTASSSRDVTLKHASGNLAMRGYEDRTLGNSLDHILLIRNGSSWYEIFTFFATSQKQRDYLSLGNAATGFQGSGNNFDADKVDGKDAADFLGVADTAVDSDALGGVAAANYARKDVSVAQTFLGNLIASVKSVVNDPTTSTPQFEGQDNGTRRILTFFNGTDLIIRLYASNGTTIAGSLKITDTTLEWSPDAEATWYVVANSSGELGLGVTSASLIAGGLSSNYVAGTLNYNVVFVVMDRLSFFPSIWTKSPVIEIQPYYVTSPSPPYYELPEIDPENPKFSLWNPYSNNLEYIVSWEYLA